MLYINKGKPKLQEASGLEVGNRNSFAKISFHCHVLTCFNRTEYILLLVVEKLINIYLSVRCIYYWEHRGEILSLWDTAHLLSVG